MAHGNRTNREFINVIPVFIPGVFSLFYHIPEGEKLRGGVIEHTVQNHPQPQSVRLVHQHHQIIGSAKGGVDGVVIDGIILMTGVGVEDGS